jgi:hypothetical protein
MLKVHCTTGGERRRWRHGAVTAAIPPPLIGGLLSCMTALGSRVVLPDGKQFELCDGLEDAPPHASLRTPVSDGLAPVEVRVPTTIAKGVIRDPNDDVEPQADLTSESILINAMFPGIPACSLLFRCRFRPVFSTCKASCRPRRRISSFRMPTLPSSKQIFTTHERSQADAYRREAFQVH